MNALEQQLAYPFGDALPAVGSTLEVVTLPDDEQSRHHDTAERRSSQVRTSRERHDRSQDARLLSSGDEGGAGRRVSAHQPDGKAAQL